MSGSANLGINISARDTASAEIKGLQQAVRGLGQTLQQLSTLGANANATSGAAIARETAAIRGKIAALQQEIAVKLQSTAEGIRAAQQEADYINRDIDLINRKAQAYIRASNASAEAQRKSTADAERFEAEALNRQQAAREASVRSQLLANNARVYKEREAADQAARSEAEYTNRGIDSAKSRAIAEAEYINQNRNLVADKARSEAEYANRDMQLIQAKQRAEATYINQGMDASQAKQRAEAEYTNQQMIAAQQRTRQLAEYENRERDLAQDKLRREAEYENAQISARAKTYSRSAPGIIEGASPAAAAGEAAARASIAGKTSAEIEAAAVRAATEARVRQKAAIDASTEAMRHAARAGGTEAEIEIAGARAATAAINAKNIAANAGGGGGGIASGLLQRESRHVIGLFDSLARGQRGQAISSIGAAARDAGLGVGALGASMGALVALMGTGAILHGAESMGRWATETRAAASATGMSLGAYSSLQGALTLMGLKAEEADTTLRRLAINLGTAIAEPTSMAAQAFHNLGISQEDLVNTGGSVESALKLLANAFQNTADGANKSANMNEIFGRGFEKIIPLLQNGSQGMEEFRAKAAALGITLNEETAASLEKTGQKADELSATIRGQGIKAFVAWGDTIREVIGILETLGTTIGKITGFVQTLNSYLSPVVNMASNISGFLANSGPRVGSSILARLGLPDYSGGGHAGAKTGDTQFGPPVAKTDVPALEKSVGPLAAMREKMAQAQMEVAENIIGKGAAVKKKALEDEARAEIKIMQDTLANEKLSNSERVALRTELANKITGLDNRMASGAGGGNKHQETTDYIADARLRVAEANGNSAKILAIYDEEIAKLKQLVAEHKATMAQVSSAEREKVQAVNKARLDEIKEGAKTTEQTNRLSGYDAQLNQMAKGQYNFGGTAQTSGALRTQSSQALAEAAQVKAAAESEIAALTQVRDTAEAGSATQKAASAEIMSVLLQSKSQEIELYKKAGEAAQAAADKAMEGFKKFFDSVGQGFEAFTDSVVKALVLPQQEIIKAGLTSITKNLRGTEIQSAFTQLANHMLTSIGSSIQEAIGSTIAKALSGGAADTIGQLLSQTFSKVLGNITGGAIGNAVGNAAGGAAGNAAVSAAITAGATATTTGISTAITASSAAQTAAVTTGSASIVAAITASAAAQEALLAANAVKPSVLGFSYAGGGVVPSAAGGMVLGDSRGGQLAILHPREMVLPAHLSKGIQGMINGQGGQQAGGPSQTNNLNYSPTVNTGSRSRSGTGMTRAEFSQMMSLHSGAMLGEARGMMKSGWRPA